MTDTTTTPATPAPTSPAVAIAKLLAALLAIASGNVVDGALSAVVAIGDILPWVRDLIEGHANTTTDLDLAAKIRAQLAAHDSLDAVTDRLAARLAALPATP